jgi:peptidoglycan hydrolase-like amidase
MNLIKECKLQIISTKVSFFTFSNILHTHFYLISLYIQSKTNTILRFKIINKKILKKLNKNYIRIIIKFSSNQILENSIFSNTMI